MKRTLYAWLLLAISTFQWIGGSVFLEIDYLVEVQFEMDAKERAVALELEQRTGLERQFKLIDEHLDEYQLPYSRDVIIMVEIDGEKYAATEVTDPTEYVELTYSHNEPLSDAPQKRATLERLFLDFTLPENFVSITKREGTEATANFTLLELQSLFTPGIPSPPPDLS